MKRILGVLTAAFILTMSMSVFAGININGGKGSWLQDDAGWKWKHEDGSFAGSGWYWLDGDEDGTAECYYFDANGRLLTDTTTPDGYTVNGDGAWTHNGIVQVTRFYEPLQKYIKKKTTADIDTHFEDGTYNKYGIHAEAMEMVCQTREENAKYGEVTVVWESSGGPTVTYQNGFIIGYGTSGRNLVQVDPSRTDLNHNHLVKFFYENQHGTGRTWDTFEKDDLLKEMGFDVVTSTRDIFDHVSWHISDNDKVVRVTWFCTDYIYLTDWTPRDYSHEDRGTLKDAAESALGGSSTAR